MWKRVRESKGGHGMAVLGVTFCVLGTVVILGVKSVLYPLPPKGPTPSVGGIYKWIFAAAVEVPQSRDFSVWPRVGSPHYETSTEYFRWLMTPRADGGAEVLDRNFRLFELGAFREADSLRDFSSVHNGWSVVTGMDERSPAGMPFLISRNLNEDQLIDWEKSPNLELNNLSPYPARGRLFTWWRKEDFALIVVRSGGAAETLSHRYLTWGNLNPTRATNPILNP